MGHQRFTDVVTRKGRLFEHETAASFLREERGQSRATVAAANHCDVIIDSSWDKKLALLINEFKGCRSGFVRGSFPLCRRAIPNP